jgi:hypothetical protein
MRLIYLIGFIELTLYCESWFLAFRSELSLTAQIYIGASVPTEATR